MKPILVSFLITLAFLSFVTDTFAVSTTIVDYPSTITNEPFTITALIKGGASGVNYLRVQLFKEGSDDYFGETKNGSDYYGGTEGEKYPSFNNSGTETQVTIIAKVGTPTPKEYDGAGNYFIRIQRYTSSGNSASSDEAKASAKPISIQLSTPTTIPTETANQSPTQVTNNTNQVSFDNNNIYISEAFVYPPTGGSEWIEIYNNNNNEVILSGWYVDDIEGGGSSPFLFSLNLPGKGYATIDLSQSIFNNSGDTVRLLDSGQNLIDSLDYTSAQTDISIGKISPTGKNSCFQTATKNKPNASCIEATATKSSSSNKNESATVIKATATAKPSSSTKPTLTTNKKPPTVTNLTNRLFSTLQKPQNKNIADTQPQVLGEKTASVAASSRNLARPLSASSAGLSLFSILYILYKVAGKIKIG